jgi:hypothetical protein
MNPMVVDDRNVVAVGWRSHGNNLGRLQVAGLDEPQSDRRGGRRCQRIFRRTGSGVGDDGIRREIGTLEIGRRYVFSIANRVVAGRGFQIVVRSGSTTEKARIAAGNRVWRRAGVVFRTASRSATVSIVVSDEPAEVLIDDALLHEADNPANTIPIPNENFERYEIRGVAPMAVHRTAGQPIIDGKNDEPFWAECEAARLIDDYGRDRSDAVETSFRIAFEGDNLLVWIECMEPRMETIQVGPPIRDSDADGYDRVEVTLRPDRTRDGCCRFVVTAGGGISDFLVAPVTPPGGDVDGSRDFMSTVRGYNADVRWNVAKEQHRWTVEMEIPFADLGVSRFGPQAVWGLNVGRRRSAGRKPQRYAWSATGGNFCRSSRMGLIAFSRPRASAAPGPAGDRPR